MCVCVCVKSERKRVLRRTCFCDLFDSLLPFSVRNFVPKTVPMLKKISVLSQTFFFHKNNCLNLKGGSKLTSKFKHWTSSVVNYSKFVQRTLKYRRPSLYAVFLSAISSICNPEMTFFWNLSSNYQSSLVFLYANSLYSSLFLESPSLAYNEVQLYCKRR